MYLICNDKVVPPDAKGAQGSRRMIDELHSSLTPGLHMREWVVSSCSHFKIRARAPFTQCMEVLMNTRAGVKDLSNRNV